VITEPTFPVDTDLPATQDEVPRVSLDQALLAHSADAAIFVDVRSPEDYATSHISGAINIPLSQFEINLANLGLDQDDWIITYCT
jgi:rhodanese-related sulfurtransferase